MMRTIKIIVLVYFASLTLSFSQGGSNYSMFGLGDIGYGQTASFVGLANTSIAFPNKHSINTVNPAMLSTMEDTRLQTGYVFNQNYISNKDNSLFQNNGKIEGINAAFVIDTGRGIAVAIGINPYTSVNYLVSSPVAINYEDISLTGSRVHEGSGGLSKVSIAASYRPLSWLAIGGEANVLFGITKSSVKTSVNDLNYYSSETSLNFNLKAGGYKFGAAIEPVSNLMLGTYYEGYSKCILQTDTVFLSPMVKDTSFTGKSDFTIPSALGFGASYRTGRFIIGCDYAMQKFSDLTFRGGPETKFRDFHRYSLGVTRIGNKSTGAEYLDKVTYNFGLGYKELYYSVKGVNINEIYGSIGFEFPMLGTALVNTAFTFGTRGTLDNSLVRENFGRMTIDISVGETWFKPFVREY